MTVEKLIRKDQGAQQIDIAKSGIRDFERVLNKYGVDYPCTAGSRNLF